MAEMTTHHTAVRMSPEAGEGESYFPKRDHGLLLLQLQQSTVHSSQFSLLCYLLLLFSLYCLYLTGPAKLAIADVRTRLYFLKKFSGVSKYLSFSEDKLN